MTGQSTEYGRLLVGPKDELFARAAALAVAHHNRVPTRPFTWALGGGGTPQEWYRWCVANRTLPADVVSSIHFTVSDERCLPIANAGSNFGQAERLLLAPLGIPEANRVPWAVELPPLEAAAEYRRIMAGISLPGHAYDICFLGMGEDCHTLSLFPGTPLLHGDGGEYFSAQEIPGKGWRLTTTPTGVRTCGLIVVMTLGANKADPLHRALLGPYDPVNVPIQILRDCADRVVWLVDDLAAAKL